MKIITMRKSKDPETNFENDYEVHNLFESIMII